MHIFVYTIFFVLFFFFFFFNDTATTEIYTLSLHDALPISAVLAQAFARASQFEIPGYHAPADRAYDYLLGLQRPDGGFDFSRGDYYFFKDRRSYPRNLAMILYHLLPVAPVRVRRPAPLEFHC